MRRAFFLVLMLALPLPVAAQITTDVAGEPTGQGNPDDITCRAPQLIPGSRNRRGPKVCKSNAVWAQYREDGMTVSEDGTHDMPVPRAKNCQSSGGGGGGSGGSTSMARGMGGSVTCE